MPRIRFALGVAPENASHYTDEIDQLLRDRAADKNVFAIGSCGVHDSDSAEQADAFRRQAAVAADTGLSLVVEAAGAYAAALEVICDAGVPGEKVLLRAFDGTCDELSTWVNRGCYISFDARAANDPMRYVELARMVPEDRLLVESGAPDVLVEALSGFDARPDQVVFVADVLQGTCCAEQLAQNAHAFFIG